MKGFGKLGSRGTHSWSNLGHSIFRGRRPAVLNAPRARPRSVGSRDIESRRRLSALLDTVESILDADSVKLLRFHLALRPTDLDGRR